MLKFHTIAAPSLRTLRSHPAGPERRRYAGRGARAAWAGLGPAPQSRAGPPSQCPRGRERGAAGDAPHAFKASRARTLTPRACRRGREGAAQTREELVRRRRRARARARAHASSHACADTELRARARDSDCPRGQPRARPSVSSPPAGARGARAGLTQHRAGAQASAGGGGCVCPGLVCLCRKCCFEQLPAVFLTSLLRK